MTADTRLCAWQTRASQLISVLGGDVMDLSHASPAKLVETVAAHITTIDAAHVWLVLGALSGSLPSDLRVQATLREARLSGPASIVETAFIMTTEESALSPIDIAVGRKIVDVEYIARAGVFTGIQRVAVELARNWHRSQDITLVAWNDCKRSMRLLSSRERDNVLGLGGASDPSKITGLVVDDDEIPTLIIPWQSTYLLVELAGHMTRLRRLLAMARHSGNATRGIVFDTVPLTLGETTSEGVPDHFVLNLAMLRHFDRVSAISQSTAAEYVAWRASLAGAGWSGPEIGAVSLPIEPVPTPDAGLAQVRNRLTLPDMPMVLCVGSHEPRKNHMAVLAAAEILWRKEFRFSLLFVAGNAWRAKEFFTELVRLQDAGYPVDSISQVDDPTLGAAYRLARMSVFPSVSEGFGLPVAESLAAGTPVVTSNFGSMAEICVGGGALLVDPRDDNAIAGAMAQLLDDDDLHARLSAECRDTATRTWAQYAEDNWRYLVDESRDDA